MARSYINALLLLLFALVSLSATASHLVGGSMSYEYLGANGNGTYKYKVTVKIYRDCNASQTPFDPSIEVGAYEDGEPLFLLDNTSFVFNLSSEVSVQPPKGSNCPGDVNVCIREGTYTSNIDLPASSNGYHLLFQRCCRNTQKNLVDSVGQSYYAFIPPTNTVNSSPYFSGVPAPYICVGDTTTYLNGATDPDGDSLSYKLVHPWAGANATFPIVSPATILTLPLPTSDYRNGYNVANPFGIGGIAAINPSNGLTTMYPPATGLYSLAIEVTEWRKGKKLSVIRRDVQIIAINCTPNQTPVIYPQSGNYNRTITAGETICFDINATDPDQSGQKVKISASGEVFGTQPGWQGPKATFTTKTGTNTVTSQFCWVTSCSQSRSAPYNFVVDAIDDGCPPKSRTVTFTVEVKPYNGNISLGGPPMVCEFDTGKVYFTASPTAGSKFKWTITGGSEVSPDSSGSIKVNWGAKGWGGVKVQETNALGCVSPEYDISVEKGGYPAPIPLVNDTVCEFTAKQYEVAPISGSQYNWLVTGGSINSKPQPHQVLVQWGGITNAAIGVIETNKYGCVGDTNTMSVLVTRSFTDSIYGSQSVCPFIKGVKYSAFPPRQESKYWWYIEGGTIIDGDSTGTITVNWGGIGVGKIRVLETTKWGCVGDTITINIIKNHVLQGFRPVGKDTLCEFTPGIPYEVVYTNGSKYFWSIEGGTIVQSDTMKSTMVADWGKFGNAKVNVYEISYDSVNHIPCIGKPVTLPVSLQPIPTAIEIVGKPRICEGEIGVPYRLNGFDGSKYKWLINGDSNGISGQGSNTIRFDGNIVGQYLLGVIETSKYGCVGQLTDTLVRVTPKPRTKPINGDTIVCYPWFNHRRYTTGGNPGSTFNWFFDGGAIDSGNLTAELYISFSGQKFNTLKVLEITDEGCLGDTLYKPIFADRPYLTTKYISVGFPDNYMDIAWQLDSAPFYKYDFGIQRRKAGSGSQWYMAGKVPGTQFKFIDTNLNTDIHPYEYRIRGINLCKTEFYSSIHTNIWLDGKQDEKEYGVNINWTPYGGWESGVNNYAVYRRNDVARFPIFARDAGTDTADFYDDALRSYIHRYRVQGTENIANPDTSWSNEIELKLIPLLWVPNAFTPNTDGLNPKFEIVGGSIKTFELDIYDRWGEKMFSTDTITHSWDGTFRGVAVPDGVYFYLLRYTGGDNKIEIRKGNITLLR